MNSAKRNHGGGGPSQARVCRGPRRKTTWPLVIGATLCAAVAGGFVAHRLWPTAEDARQDPQPQANALSEKPPLVSTPDLPESEAIRPEPAPQSPHQTTAQAEAQEPLGTSPRLPVPSTESVATPPEPEAKPPEPPSALPKTLADLADLAAAPETTNRALRKEQLEVANRLVKALPTSPDAVYLLGLVHQEQGDVVEAQKCWQRARQLNPNRADVYDSLGHLATLKGEYEEAVALFRKALQLDPRAPNVHYRLGHALTRLGRMEQAISALEDDLKVSPAASGTYRLLGDACRQLKAYDRAKTYYQKAIEIREDFPEAHYGLAVTCAKLKQKEQSREHQQKFKQLETRKQKTGRDWRAKFDAQESLIVTRRSVAHTHTDVGRVYGRFARVPDAEKLWQRAAVLDPKNAVCRLELATMYQQRNMELEAVRWCRQVTDIDPQNAPNHMRVGILHVRMKRPEAAEADFKKVVQLAPQRTEGHLALAQLYLRTGRQLGEAVRLARRAVELEPIAPNYWILGEACEKNGDRAGALAAARRATELDPGNPRFRRTYEIMQKRE